MKRIQIVALFKDDGQTFYPGEVRMVSPEKAGYFCGLGWARDVDGQLVTGEATPADVKLDIHPGRAVHAVTKIGDK